MNASESDLQVQTREDAGLAVVSVGGDIDLRSSPTLREHLRGWLERRPPRLVVDLSGVAYMDSSGVGTLVEFKRNLERGGGRLVLIGLQPRVRSVFEITQLHRFFAITGTLDEARSA